MRRCDCSGLSGGVLGGGREVGDGDAGWQGLPALPGPRGAVGLVCVGWSGLVVLGGVPSWVRLSGDMGVRPSVSVKPSAV
jgi:hypothetical protein